MDYTPATKPERNRHGTTQPALPGRRAKASASGAMKAPANTIHLMYDGKIRCYNWSFFSDAGAIDETLFI